MDKAGKERIDRLIDSFYEEYAPYKDEILYGRYDYSEIKKFLDYSKELLEDIKSKFCNKQGELVISQNQSLLALGYAELIVNNVIRKSRFIRSTIEESILSSFSNEFEIVGHDFEQLYRKTRYRKNEDPGNGKGENELKSSPLDDLKTYQFINEYDNLMNGIFCQNNESNSDYNIALQKYHKMREDNKLYPLITKHGIDRLSYIFDEMFSSFGMSDPNYRVLSEFRGILISSKDESSLVRSLKSLQENVLTGLSLSKALQDAGSLIKLMEGNDRKDEKYLRDCLPTVIDLEHQRYLGKSALGFKKYFSQFYKDTIDAYKREYWVEQRAQQNESLRKCKDTEENLIFKEGYPIGVDVNAVDYIRRSILERGRYHIIDDPSFYTYITRIELIDRILKEFDDIENHADPISIISNGTVHVYHIGKNDNSQTMNSFEVESLNAPQLPHELSTPEAKRLLDLAQNEGWLDENYQPQGLLKVQKALLVGHICNKLWKKNKWALFEKFWNERTLAGSFKDGFESENQRIFWNRVTDVIK